MTDHDDDVTRAYRELPRDEPPAAIDRSILSSARRAVEAPRRRRQWALPVSLAAVLVLALGITLRMQREEPGIETSMPSREQPRSTVEPLKPEQEEARTPPAAPARQQKPMQSAAPLKKKALAIERDEGATRKDTSSERAAEPARPREAESNIAPAPEAKTQLAPAAPPATVAAPPPVAAAPPPAAAAQSAPAAAPAPALRAKREAQGFAADMAKQSQADPLLKELERIAQLRREGRNEEADQALEKFRKENPQYRIPDALWEQVRPR